MYLWRSPWKTRQLKAWIVISSKPLLPIKEGHGDKEAFAAGRQQTDKNQGLQCLQCTAPPVSSCQNLLGSINCVRCFQLTGSPVMTLRRGDLMAGCESRVAGDVKEQGGGTHLEKGHRVSRSVFRGKQWVGSVLGNFIWMQILVPCMQISKSRASPFAGVKHKRSIQEANRVKHKPITRRKENGIPC